MLVDDYDLVAPRRAAAHPLLPLVEFLPQAKDVGLHVVRGPALRWRRAGAVRPAARAAARARRARVGDQRQPGRGRAGGGRQAGPLPPGRGMLVDRRRGARRVQLAWLAPATDERDRACAR